jgi:hypothetical protein
MDSANHILINPLAVDTPVWNLPATHPYCCAIAVLEWKAGRVTVLSPVACRQASIFHDSCSSAFLVYLYRQFYKYFHMDDIRGIP